MSAALECLTGISKTSDCSASQFVLAITTTLEALPLTGRGLQPHAYTPAQILANGIAMNPTGTQPAFPPIPEPFAGNAGRAIIAIHEAANKEIEKQKTFLLLLKARLHVCIANDEKAAIEMHYAGGLPFNQLTPYQVINGYRATQMTYSVQDHAGALEFLQMPPNGATMDRWICNRQQKIRTAADNGMPISTHDQKILIRTALAHTHGFNTFMDTYHQTTPEAEQTMTHLHTQLCRHFKHQESVKRAKGIRGAANAVDDIEEDDEEIGHGAAEEKDLRAEVKRLQQEVAKLKKAEKGKAPTTSSDCYCWTHGPNATHNSAACRWKQPGHVDDATAADKRGGSTVKWSKRTK